LERKEKAEYTSADESIYLYLRCVIIISALQKSAK